MFSRPPHPGSIKKLNLFTIMLLGVGLSLGLAACGENTAPPGNQSGQELITPTVAATTTGPASAAPIPSTAASRPATPPVSSQPPQASPTVTAARAPGPSPFIRFSTASLKVGETLTVSGSGYPPATKLNVKVGNTKGSGLDIYANPVTDNNGAFSTRFKIESGFSGTTAEPVILVIRVETIDNKVAQSATLPLLPRNNLATTASLPYQPVVGAARSVYVIGQEVTLTGLGYPANLELNIAGGMQNPSNKHGSIRTDVQGNFSKQIRLRQEDKLVGGPYTFAVADSEYKYSAIVTVTLVDSNAAQDEASMLVHRFYHSLGKQENKLAFNQLSVKLQSRVQTGQLKLEQIAGVELSLPLRVEVIVSEEAKGYNRKAILHFYDGSQRQVYLLVGPDASGEIRIIATNQYA